MLLPPKLIRSIPLCSAPRFDADPIQAGFEGSPWHVACASIALCRVQRNVSVIRCMFVEWPTPELMEASDVALEDVLRPLGLQRQRARSIQQLSRKWHTDTWNDLRDLNGVGRYVAAAVELFCFGCAENAGCDHVLESYARTTLRA